MPRTRSNGDNAIFEKKGRGWVGIVDLPGSTRAKRKRKYFYGPNSGNIREQIRAWTLGEGRRHDPTSSKTLFSDYVTNWMAGKTNRPKTLRSYNSTINNHVTPYLGSAQIGKIDHRTLDDYFKKLITDGIGGRTRQLAFCLLTQIFKSAVANKTIVANPLSDIEKPTNETRLMKIWSIEEVHAFLSSVEHEQHRTLYLVALSTGMRLGEILGLQWNFVNFERRTIQVQQQLTEKRVFALPKSKASRRTVAVGDGCITALREHRKNQFKSGFRSSMLVFASTKGTPIFGGNLTNRHFPRDIEAAGVSRIRFHDLRHTFASIRLANGDNIKMLAATLGHDDPALTLRTYAHLMEGQQREAADRHDEYLRPSIEILRPSVVGEP